MENQNESTGSGVLQVLGDAYLAGTGVVPPIEVGRPLVVSHRGCYDGTCGALVAYLRFGDEADYRFASYADEPLSPDVVRGRDVFLIDFSFKPDVMAKLVEAARKVVFLDHHKSAREELGPFIAAQYPNITYKDDKFGANLVVAGALTNFGYFDCPQDALLRQAFALEEAADKETADKLRELHRLHKFHFVVDMDRSGASIAWDYFFSDAKPEFVKLVEDRDLWRNKLEGVEEFHSYLFTLGFDNPKAWLEAWVTPIDALVERGKVAKAAKEAACEIALKYSGLIEFEGLRACALNFNLYQGDIGHLLVERSPSKFGVLYWFDHATKQYMVSMRSKGDLDVSKIAQKYGGGGHKNASGFQCKELPWASS